MRTDRGLQISQAPTKPHHGMRATSKSERKNYWSGDLQSEKQKASRLDAGRPIKAATEGGREMSGFCQNAFAHAGHRAKVQIARS
jgi:hypothetical protein